MEKSLKKTECIEVYVCKTDRFSSFSELPAYAVKELESVSRPCLRAQKRCIYGLLAYATENGLGEKWNPQKLLKNDVGKPIADGWFCSLSHTEQLVAVAVARKSVGIDLERENRFVSERFFEHVLHETDVWTTDKEQLIRLWTKKEALFKQRGTEKVFHPKHINVRHGEFKTVEVRFLGKRYFLSVAFDGFSDVRIYPLDREIYICE